MLNLKVYAKMLLYEGKNKFSENKDFFTEK